MVRAAAMVAALWAGAMLAIGAIAAPAVPKATAPVAAPAAAAKPALAQVAAQRDRYAAQLIVELPGLPVSGTCVRVPVFVGHSEAINIEFEKELSAKKAQSILREAPGIMLIDKHEDGGYATPIEAAGDDATYVSRVREDATVENGLNLWCVSDNLRKGAALNAVQIAELLGSKVLKKG